MIESCNTAQDWQRLLADSHEKPAFLLKHSTRCSISAGAWRRFQAFAEGADAGFWRVLVIEDRPLSQQIARETGVTHQSPQVILFREGKAVWNASHWSITADEMTDALLSTGGSA